MLTINEYRKVESLEEAYELNQKKNNKIHRRRCLDEDR